MVAEQTLLLDSIRIHYTVEGRGPDVLLIHGWAASRRMWMHLSRQLASAYRCWSIDLPGFGDSDKPLDQWYSIPNYTSVLRDFVLSHRLSRAHLVGHSMGGLIALDFAVTHPELIERLIAINPVVTGRAHLRQLLAPRLGRQLLGWTLRLSPRVVQPVLRHPLSDRLHHGLKHIRRRTEDFARGTLDSIWGSGRAVIEHDLSPHLERVTAPTLVILGNQDLVVPNSEGQLAAERIPHARLSVLRAGHLVTDDCPAETVGLIREFFD
ncbi:MAG: alpha/beta fold hydrolase [Anaerolineales bacterium]